MIQVVYPEVHSDIFRFISDLPREERADYLPFKMLHTTEAGEEIKWYKRGYWYCSVMTGDAQLLERIRDAVERVITALTSEDNTLERYYRESPVAEKLSFAVTRAPISYDYSSYTISLKDLKVIDEYGREQDVRLVAFTDAERAKHYQMPRYWSGLCTTWEITEELAETLLKAESVGMAALYDNQAILQARRAAK